MRRHSSLDSNSDFEKERERRRRLWMIQQEKEREHEKLKQKKIAEYEKKRAKLLGLSYKERSMHRSRSKSRSRSRSQESQQRSHSRPIQKSELRIVPIKINSTPGNKPLFIGPSEAPKLCESDLHRVTVKIQRKIPAPSIDNNEIIRGVVNPEEIVLKRREGEGSKPIFDREELKQTDEVEERRTIEANGHSNQDKRPHSKRRSVSLRPTAKHRSPSPHSRSGRSPSRSHSYRSRHEEQSRYRLEDRHPKNHRHHSRTRDKSREDWRRHKSPRRRSQSRERDFHRSERDYSRSSRFEKDYRELRGRSIERVCNLRGRRESSVDRHHSSASAYMETIPYPMYFGSFPPRPVMIPPSLPPIRLPGTARSRGPVAPIRPPYPPRFIPPDMYRGILPPDPRYPRMY